MNEYVRLPGTWSGTATSTATSTAAVLPKTLWVRAPVPDPALHNEQKVALAARPAQPTWIPQDSHRHLGMPIDWVILAGSVLVIVAWHTAQARRAPGQNAP